MFLCFRLVSTYVTVACLVALFVLVAIRKMHIEPVACAGGHRVYQAARFRKEQCYSTDLQLTSVVWTYREC